MSEDRRLPVRAVSFDATGTLLHAPRLAEIHAEVLGRHGLEVAAEDVPLAFRRAWQDLDCRVPAGTDRYASHPAGARGFWQELLERMCLHLGLPAPSRFAAAELYERFSEAGAWEIYPEVVPLLLELRERGFRVAVTSNWDDRLPRVLQALGLSKWIDVVLTSHAEGCAKPARRLFHRAASLLAIDPVHLLHVGDQQIEDAEGALAAGCQALLLDRSARGGQISSLDGLLERIVLARPVATEAP